MCCMGVPLSYTTGLLLFSRCQQVCTEARARIGREYLAAAQRTPQYIARFPPTKITKLIQ